MPSSITSAPPATSASRLAAVSPSPAVMKQTSAGRPLAKAEERRVIQAGLLLMDELRRIRRLVANSPIGRGCNRPLSPTLSPEGERETGAPLGTKALSPSGERVGRGGRLR